LKQFWGKSLINDTTEINPALSQIAGEIWNKWLKMKNVTGALSVLAQNNPATPPDFGWIVNVTGSIAWHNFTTQKVDFVFRTGIVLGYTERVKNATSGGVSTDQIIKTF